MEILFEVCEEGTGMKTHLCRGDYRREVGDEIDHRYGIKGVCQCAIVEIGVMPLGCEIRVGEGVA